MREPFWTVLGRVLGETFSLDSRLDRTIRPFLLQPGFLTREFNQGRRAQYTAPFKLYLLASLVLFFSIGIQRRIEAWGESRSSTESTATSTPDGQSQEPSPMQFDLGDEEKIRGLLGEDTWMYRTWSRQRSRFESLSEEEQEDLVVTGALRQMPTMLLLMLPISALLLRLIFLRSGAVFGEHFVFVLHVHAFYCVAFLVPTFLHHWTAWALVGIVIPLYFLVALHRAYDQRVSTTLLRAVALLPLYLAIFLPMLISLIFLGVFAA